MHLLCMQCSKTAQLKAKTLAKLILGYLHLHPLPFSMDGGSDKGVGKSMYPLSANDNVLSANSRLVWELH